MKKQIKYTILSTLVAAGMYFVTDTIRKSKEKIFRLAAGESNYERTHKRK